MLHLFYILFAVEVIIAIVAYTNVVEYPFMPVKGKNTSYLSEMRLNIYLCLSLLAIFFFHAFKNPQTLDDIPYYVDAFYESRNVSWGRVIDMGYETVFRQEHDGQKNYDLTIKTSDDSEFVKNIEVKQVTSENSSKVASNLKKAFIQVGEGGTVAIYLPNRSNCPSAVKFVKEGFAEAQRKGFVKGPVEVWFKDKTKIDL